MRNSVMGAIRMMDVDDVAFFPLKDWGNIRSIASKLKEDFGVVYRVKSVKDEIKVERLS